MIQAGSICKKLAGKEAGRYCVVVSLDEKGRFAQIAGVAKYGMCKAGRCNTKHLKATQFKINLKSTKQEDIDSSIMESGVINKMGLKKDKRMKYIKVVKCWNKSTKANREKTVQKKPAGGKTEKKEEAKPKKAEEKKAKPAKKAAAKPEKKK